MKKQTIKTKKQTQQELLIQKALRTGGFLFPETVSEVIEFEKNFGNTDFILPEDLREPVFLKSMPRENTKVVTLVQNENYAVAARKGNNAIPDEIKLKMENDRKKIIKGKNIHPQK